MDERVERIGLNEAVFREVNERIGDLAETFSLTDEPLDLVCECGDASCTQRITMTKQAYEQVRAEPTYFAVYPGHEIPDVEEIVEKRGSYDLIRKYEREAAELARETDPRS